MNAYRNFWSKNTSKVFEVTVLWGLILGASAMFLLISYHLAGINVGELLDDAVGQEAAYWIMILAFQLGMAGGTLLWLPATLRLAAMKWDNFFSHGALALYVLFFGGLQFTLACWTKLRIAGMGSDDSQAAMAIIVISVVLMATVTLVEHKTRRKGEI